MRTDREAMEYDVVIVGAGPSGLAAAIRLKQLAAEHGQEISVCVLEKGSEVGAHILSGAVLEPRALDELFPDWQERGAPLNTPAGEDRFLFLTESGVLQAADAAADAQPRQLHHQPRQSVPLAGRAGRGAGRRDLPGLRRRRSAVPRGRQGQGRGHRRYRHRPGRQAQRTTTSPAWSCTRSRRIFAEGCRGSLTKALFERFSLRDGVDPQTYGIGIKELWEVDPAKHQPGLVVHTVGWPLRSDTYGGSFLYHLENNQVAVGFVVGLDYRNPYLSPFEEFQRFKTHPAIRRIFEGGRRIAYGARALSEGGFQSIPKLAFPGGLLIGDTAGFLNVPKIKGTHTAMKSGMIAAEAVFEHSARKAPVPKRPATPSGCRQSWVWDELLRVRNIRPSFRWGLWGGSPTAHRHLRLPGQGAVDPAPPRRPYASCGDTNCHAEDRLPEAGRQAHLRPAVLGVHLQHQPRGGPAAAICN